MILKEKLLVTLVNNFIGIYPSSIFNIDTSYCDDIIDWFKKDNNTVVGGIGSKFEYLPDIKDSLDNSLNNAPPGLRNNYINNLFQCIELYKKEYEYCDTEQHEWTLDPCINIQYYKPGGGFKQWHYENRGSPPSDKRHLVFMTYLNSVNNGGTEFYYQNLKTEAIKGNTIIWPAGWTHTHRGVIAEEEKYILTGWFVYDNSF